MLLASPSNFKIKLIKGNSKWVGLGQAGTSPIFLTLQDVPPWIGCCLVPITVPREVPSGVSGSNGLGGNTALLIPWGERRGRQTTPPVLCLITASNRKNKSDSVADLLLLLDFLRRRFCKEQNS